MFLLETKNQIVTLEKEFNQLKANPAYNRDAILRILHTIKGGAATFSYNTLKETAHQMEEHMLPQNDLNQGLAVATDLKKKIESETSVIINFYKDVFGELSRQDDDQIVLSGAEVQSMLRFQRLEEIRAYLEEKIYFQPVKNLVSQFPIVIEKTAQLLNKSINPLIIKNDSTLVPLKAFDAFFNSFIHVLRNSVDHGIETSSVRQQKNKNSAGSLTLEFQTVESDRKYLQVKFKDDGQGVNAGRIRQKLDQKGISHADIPNEQVIYFIFNPSFSTRDDVTETSGRGVGLDAVKYEVDQLNGKIEIKTEVGKFTEFIFHLPYPQKTNTVYPKSA